MADDQQRNVIQADQLGEGKPVAATYAGEDVVVVRHRGVLCAFSGTCTHLKAPLADGIVVGGELRCPWHHARFSLDTGEAVGAPALEPLHRFTVVEEDGLVTVTGKADTPAASPTPRDIGRVLIVGGGAAGHACADMLARHGAGASVTIVSDDRDAPYDRTFCSKQYLAGKVGRKEAMLPAPGLGEAEGVTVRTEVAVASIDLAAKAVTTATGERIGYDTLVLATGASPTVPPFKGAGRDDVFVVRTLADADALIAAADAARRAIVIGSSYVGLEVAASLIVRGLSVTVVAQGSVPLAGTAGPEVGGMIRSLHESKGVSFHMEREVAAWDGRTATLDDGSTVEGDFVVAGTGVEPRVGIAKAAGLAMADDKAGGGVQVDATLRTSAPDVYAIGDIASVPDPRLGHAIRVEHWVVAQRMGQWLARHLLGDVEATFGETPFFWSGHYDTSLRYIGHVASPDDRRIDGDVAEQDVAVTFREDGRDRALLTCNRDKLSLTTEATWDR